jgi:hypothetical protein
MNDESRRIRKGDVVAYFEPFSWHWMVGTIRGQDVQSTGTDRHDFTRDVQRHLIQRENA